MKLVEPPSFSLPSAIVFIGKNKRGNWVAQEQHGLYGGLSGTIRELTDDTLPRNVRSGPAAPRNSEAKAAVMK